MSRATSVVSEASDAPARALDTIRFDLRELSGSLGDLGTFLPLALAMSVTGGFDFGVVLVWAGAMNIATGLAFRQPVAVQPMKAIAAVAIAEGLSAGDVAAAGLLVGAAVFTLGVLGVAEWVGRKVPKAIVRGIQLGIGAKLALAGAAWLFGVHLGIDGVTVRPGLPLFGHDSLVVAGIAAALLFLPALRRTPILLVVFLGGFLLLRLGDPGAFEGLRFAAPHFGLVWPSADSWIEGGLRGGIPQVPLTLLNSVLAVCALSADYFPGRGIAPRRMATSVGLMNLVGVPLGAIPMCHGAGGLAGQVRFGARTGGSVILLGAFKVAAGLVFGAALVGLLGAYPRSILGVMLVVAGTGLAAVARDSLRRGRLLVVLATAVSIVAVNTAVGFAVGLGVWLLVGRRGCACPVDAEVPTATASEGRGDAC